jgi:enamine deaminase RidA (YjgF/YER057c/UK114 family)
VLHDTAGFGRLEQYQNLFAIFFGMREFRSNVPGLSDPPEPYSYSVRAGRTIYLAGQVALDEHMQIVGSTLAEQARQVWHNIEAVLAASGAALTDVVKINYFLQDIRELPEEIEVRKELFAAEKMPAVTAVQAAALGLPGLKMEVDIVAVLSDA